MVQELKRTLCLLLSLALAASMAGCAAGERDGGGEAVAAFLAHITAGDYVSAYDMLSAASRNDTERTAKTCITRDDFIKKYENIFDALEITAVEYSNLVSGGGEILCSVKFDGVYRSDYVGDIESSFSVVAVREGGVWCIEWTPALIFPEMEWGDTVRIASIAAERGEILADGEVLAATVGAVSVYANVDAIEDEALFSSRVGALLGMEAAKVEKTLEKAYDGVAIIKQFFSDELPASVREQLLQIKGVGIDNGNYGKNREYPHGSLLAHLVGYVGIVPNESDEALAAELAALNDGRSETDGLYTSDSIIGRLGLEKQYEKELRGRDGEMVYICTEEGTNRRTLYQKDAEDGDDLILTVDMQLQDRLESIMELVVFGESTAGAVIVMDPTTGAIEAITSYPSYDLNSFTRGISSDEYSELLNNPAKPLINRATQGLYPPGSTMKAFTAAAALDLGIITTDYTFNEHIIEKDYWTPTEYGQWIWTPIKRTHINYPESGPLNMRKAFIHSDNIYFASVALLTGWDKFLAYMNAAGFSETVPYDIGVAEPQLINEGAEKNYKLLADSGYGQGEILITPLQLATLFCAFANGGDVPVPYVIEGIYREDGIKYDVVRRHENAVWRENIVSDSTISLVTPMLEDVVDPQINGTGRKLKVTGCTVAAKTGTAEIGNDKSREISWFVGYRTGVDAENARLVLVMLEIPADNAYTSLKFEIARELLKME